MKSSDIIGTALVLVMVVGFILLGIATKPHCPRGTHPVMVRSLSAIWACALDMPGIDYVVGHRS